MFEWHFTIRGAPDTEFAGGIYHGRILLPPEYPFKPPHIVFLTPSGRFETQTKVCLSFSAHHPELWQPAWGIRLILEALISFLPTPADGAIGALDWTKEERKKLAKSSVKFRCPLCCGDGETCVDLLPPIKAKKEGGGESSKKTKFKEEIEKLKMLQFQNHAIDEEDEKSSEEVKLGGASETKEQSTPLLTNEVIETTKQSAASPTKPDIAAKEDETGVRSEASTALSVSDKSSTAAVMVLSNDGSIPPPSPAVTTSETVSAEPVVAAVNDAPLVTDTCLNGLIAAFAIVVLVLLRQAQSLVEELRSLDSESN
jgi:ubiquitin-conjugating enzyme E2 J1